MLASALTLAAAFTPQEPSPGIDRELARARAATVKDVEKLMAGGSARTRSSL